MSEPNEDNPSSSPEKTIPKRTHHPLPNTTVEAHTDGFAEFMELHCKTQDPTCHTDFLLFQKRDPLFRYK